MSSALRKKRANSVVWALLALLILGLGGFGVTNFSGRVTSIGSVGDRDIEVNDYVRTLNREMQATSAQIGQTIGFPQAQALGMDRAVQAQLFSAAAMDNEADRLKLSIGDEELHKRVLAFPAFQGLDGTFDRDTYKLVLRQEGMSEAQFEEKLRDEAGRGILQSAIYGGVGIPDTYVETVSAWSAETRSFTLARLLPSDLAEPVPAPTDDEVKAYYDANPEPFTAPETRNLTTIWLSPEKVAETVEVDEAALRQAYEERKAEFIVPERRLVERLVFGSEDEAKAAKARLDAGEIDFATLVSERGLSLADIDLGEQTRESLGEAGDAIFALTEPAVIGPLPSDLGPALYSMNAILEAQETTFEEATDELDGEARLDRARRVIGEKTAEIEDMLASGAPLEDVAKDLGLELGTMAFSKDSEGGLAAYAEFRQAAEAVTAEDFPELVSLEDGGVFALRLDSIVAPTLKPLEEVRKEVVAAWTAAETQRRLSERAAEIAASADNGVTLESLGLVTTRYDNFARGGHIAEAPARVADAVFKTEAGKTAVIAEGSQVNIIQVSEIHPADPNDPEVAAARAQIKARADQGIAQDVLDLFTQGVEAEAGIRLDTVALEAVHAQLQ